jgi:ubiquinol-cytochrome c reductase iron-sulfur subunit
MAESTGFTRRHFLTLATALTGGVGVIAATAVPFVASSFKPSARAQALGAPVESRHQQARAWRTAQDRVARPPVYVLHRTQRDARSALSKTVGELARS